MVASRRWGRCWAESRCEVPSVLQLVSQLGLCGMFPVQPGHLLAAISGQTSAGKGGGCLCVRAWPGEKNHLQTGRFHFGLSELAGGGGILGNQTATQRKSSY